MSISLLVKRASLLVLTLVLTSVLALAVLILSVSHSEPVRLWLVNSISQAYGIELVSWQGLSWQVGQQPAISLGSLVVKLDPQQLQQVIAPSEPRHIVPPVNLQQSIALVMTQLRSLPPWLPALSVSRLQFEWQSISAAQAISTEQTMPSSQPIPRSPLIAMLQRVPTLQVRQLQLRTGLTPQLSLSLWQPSTGGQATQPDYQQIGQWQSQLGANGALTSSFSLLLDDIRPWNSDLEVRGSLIGRLNVPAGQSSQLSWQLQLDEGAIDELLGGLHLLASGELQVNGQTWSLSTLSMRITKLKPLHLGLQQCLRWRQLIAALPASSCDPLSQLAAITLTPQLPIAADYTVANADSAVNWQLTSAELGASLQLSGSQLDVKLSDLLVNAKRISTHWALTSTGNSQDFSDVNQAFQLESEGALTLTAAASMLPAKAKVMLNKARLTLAQPRAGNFSAKRLNAKLSAPAQLLLSYSPMASSSADKTSLHVDRVSSGFAMAPLQLDIITAVVEGGYRQPIGSLLGHHAVAVTAANVHIDSRWQLGSAQWRSQDEVTFVAGRVTGAQGQWQLPPQDLPSVIMTLPQYPKLLQAMPQLAGTASYHWQANQGGLRAELDTNLTAANGQYKEMAFSDAETNWHCQLSDGKTGCNVQAKLASINVGTVVEDINLGASIALLPEYMQLHLQQAEAKLFAGKIWLQPLTVTVGRRLLATPAIAPFSTADSLTRQPIIIGKIAFANIALADIIALYQLPGVKVTGRLKGSLPFTLQGKAITVRHGVIQQQKSGGVIQITDNPTIAQLKLSRPELSYALDLLANLDYHYLQSEVDYQPNGLVKLIISIKGNNPVENQPIEFNYTHQENLLLLLRSLQIDDSVTEAIEKREQNRNTN